MPRKQPNGPQRSPSRAAFDYSLDFKTIDFRQYPELYRVGKGEQGVLLIEPYKSEILPHWACLSSTGHDIGRNSISRHALASGSHGQ